jgi:hypothetical protein
MGDASARRRRGEGEVGWAQRQVRAVAGAGSEDMRAAFLVEFREGEHAGNILGLDYSESGNFVASIKFLCHVKPHFSKFVIARISTHEMAKP